VSVLCRLSSLLATLVVTPTALAQGPTPVSSGDSGTKAPLQTPPSALPFAFSGVIYANFQYGGVKGNRSQNRFDLDRA